jgi:hypothetical protein
MKKIIVIMMAVVMAAMMFTACGTEKSVHTRGLMQPSKKVEDTLPDGLRSLVCKAR